MIMMISVSSFVELKIAKQADEWMGWSLAFANRESKNETIFVNNDKNAKKINSQFDSIRVEQAEIIIII